jgi:DNA-binding transcriptional regulator YiaG
MSGADVKAWREERHLSQSDLARLLPVNLKTLQNWELMQHGRGQPPPYINRALNDLDRELKQLKKGKR